MAKKAENDMGKFPTMGESIPHSLLNLSGERSPYTTATPKKAQGRGASPTGATGKKGNSQISEAHGPRCYVSETLYKANAASAQDVQRNTHMVPSAIGDRDFWSKRQYGQAV